MTPTLANEFAGGFSSNFVIAELSTNDWLLPSVNKVILDVIILTT